MDKFFGFIKRVAMFPLNVFMGATTDLTGGASAASSWRQRDKRFVTRPITITVPLAGATNDILKTIPIAAGWLVEGIVIKNVTPAVGTACLLDVGITGGTANGFKAAFDGKSAAGTVGISAPGTDAYTTAGGYFAATAGTIDVKLNTITAMTAGAVFTVQAMVTDTNA